MKILITGGSGFIGSHLIPCLSSYHEIFAVVRKKPIENSSIAINWIEQDLSKGLEEKRLPDQIDAIIHLAQSRDYREFPERSQDIFETNTRSTFLLLEYGRKIGIQKFIYASSGGIYGYSYEKFIETSEINPINFYLTTKYCSELLIGNYNSSFNTVVYRFFFVYGHNQKGMLIPRLLSNIRRGEPITIFGKYGMRINPIHVRDAIKVFQPSLQNNITGVFNIAGEEMITVKELSELIAQCAKKPPKYVYRKRDSLGNILGDNSRMKTILGVVPEVTLKDGISEVVQLSEENQI